MLFEQFSGIGQRYRVAFQAQAMVDEMEFSLIHDPAIPGFIGRAQPPELPELLVNFIEILIRSRLCHEGILPEMGDHIPKKGVVGDGHNERLP